MKRTIKKLAQYDMSTFNIFLFEYPDSYLLRYSKYNEFQSQIMYKSQFEQKEAIDIYYQMFLRLHPSS